MSTNSSLIKVGGLEVLLLRKDIKNMHLNVLPPNGAVRRRGGTCQLPFSASDGSAYAIHSGHRTMGREPT